MSEVDFICPALQDRLEGLEAAPAPAELSWDICSNGGVSILFAFILFVGFFFAVRIFYHGQQPGYVLTHPFEPFEPPSLRFFVACIGGMSFILTAPMFYTRFTEGRWIGKFVMQQLLPDFFAELVGCEPLNGGNTTYLLYPIAGDPDSGNQVEEFDYNFYSDIAVMPHAFFGLCWDFFGTLHIFIATYAWAHVGDRSFHKKLGYFSICIFFCHMCGASHILYRDIVHHNSFPRFSLFADVIQSIAYITRGLNAIWDKSGDAKHQEFVRTTHKIMMFIGFVHAIEGSGQIRFTAWWIWMISRFVPMRYAVYFDTTVCQGTNYATCPRASAGNCVLAYMIRMNFLRMTSIVWKIIFFRIEKYSYLSNSMTFVKKELKTQVITFGMLVLGMMWIEFRADDRFPWLNAFFGGQLYSVLFFGIPVLLRLGSNSQEIRICIVLALIWNASPYTPTFLQQEWVFFIISCSLFGYSTNEYCNNFIKEIAKDEEEKKK